MDAKTVAGKIYANKGNPRILERIHGDKGRVLDVGCGAGDNASVLFARGFKIDGVTLSEDEAVIAAEFCEQVLIHNLEAGLPSQLTPPYDYVICSHVLEHICFPQRLLADIRSSLKEDGRLLVALPNLLFWKNRLRLMRGQFEYQNAGLMDNTHFRWYTFSSAQKLLQNNGFIVEEAYPDGGLPISGLRKRLPKWTYSWADRLLQRIMPGMVAYQMVYVARKNPDSRVEKPGNVIK